MQNIVERKILNAIKYFVNHTKYVGKTKLFKLLYYLDFMYLKKHGQSITLYDYYAFDYGPVPKELYNQITNNDLPDYLKNDIKIIDTTDGQDESNIKQFKVELKNKNIDLSCFTPYELQTLKDVAFIFKDATAKDMTEASHLKNQPWERTIIKKGMHEKIDYELALDEESEYDIDYLHEYVTLQRELNKYGRF